MLRPLQLCKQHLLHIVWDYRSEAKCQDPCSYMNKMYFTLIEITKLIHNAKTLNENYEIYFILYSHYNLG
jgi:hypothetical protein